MTNEKAQGTWPDHLMIRDTGLNDDAGGLGQRIFTTAGAGYEKIKYVRADLAEVALNRGGAEAVAWLRDIDGTGSLHPAAAYDAGAFPVFRESAAAGVPDGFVLVPRELPTGGINIALDFINKNIGAIAPTKLWTQLLEYLAAPSQGTCSALCQREGTCTNDCAPQPSEAAQALIDGDSDKWVAVKPEGAPYYGIHTADGRTIAGTSSGLSDRDAKRICALHNNELSEADDLIRSLGYEPERFRTDFGWINHYKLAAAIRFPDDYDGLALNREVVQPLEQRALDKGPWRVTPNGVNLSSGDFAHDVTLSIIGDFADTEQRKQYADALCAQLNAALSQPQGERECCIMTKEQYGEACHVSPSGVVVDEAMVERAQIAWMSAVPLAVPGDSTEFDDGMRAALQAALNGFEE